MSILSRCASGFVAAMFFTAAHAAPPQVNAEPMDLDADISAKIHLGKARQRTPSTSDGGGAPSGSSSECGTVNINSNDKKSNSGVKEMFGKQSTTIVTGPVINMAKCK